VRGIAGQQDPAVAEAFGDERVHHPVLNPQHVDRQVGAGADGARDEIVPVGVLGVVRRGSGPEPASLGVDRAEPAVRGEVHPGGLVGGPAGEVGVEHDGGAAPHRSGAGGVDTQPLADSGVRAVGGEYITSTNAGLRTTFAVDEYGHDALCFLDQVDELDPEPRLRACGGEQGGFQPILRGEGADLRAFGYRRVHPDHPLCGEIGVEQGVAEADAAELSRECAVPDLGGEPELAKDLHRADVDQPGSGKR